MRALPARLVVVGGAIAAVLVALASLAFGVYPVTLGEIGQALAGLVGGGDTLARSAAPPQELPLGVVTSIIGVPAFLVIMRSLRVRRSGL